MRTPVFDNLPSESRQNVATNDSRAKGQEADSMATGAAVLSSSLCSSETSIPLADRPDDDCHYPPSDMWETDEAGNLPIIDSGDRTPDGKGAKSPKEAQDGTIDGEAYPE